jgi:hypothetical protein
MRTASVSPPEWNPMEVYKIVITVAGLGLALALSMIAELLCKAQTARRDLRTGHHDLRARSFREELQDDETPSESIPQRS